MIQVNKKIWEEVEELRAELKRKDDELHKVRHSNAQLTLGLKLVQNKNLNTQQLIKQYNELKGKLESTQAELASQIKENKAAARSAHSTVFPSSPRGDTTTVSKKKYTDLQRQMQSMRGSFESQLKEKDRIIKSLKFQLHADKGAIADGRNGEDGEEQEHQPTLSTHGVAESKPQSMIDHLVEQKRQRHTSLPPEAQVIRDKASRLRKRAGHDVDNATARKEKKKQRRQGTPPSPESSIPSLATFTQELADVLCSVWHEDEDDLEKGSGGRNNINTATTTGDDGDDTSSEEVAATAATTLYHRPERVARRIVSRIYEHSSSKVALEALFASIEQVAKTMASGVARQRPARGYVEYSDIAAWFSTGDDDNSNDSRTISKNRKGSSRESFITQWCSREAVVGRYFPWLLLCIQQIDLILMMDKPGDNTTTTTDNDDDDSGFSTLLLHHLMHSVFMAIEQAIQLPRWKVPGVIPPESGKLIAETSAIAAVAGSICRIMGQAQSFAIFIIDLLLGLENKGSLNASDNVLMAWYMQSSPLVAALDIWPEVFYGGGGGGEDSVIIEMARCLKLFAYVEREYSKDLCEVLEAIGGHTWEDAHIDLDASDGRAALLRLIS
jgi:hypothetical protein